MIEIPTSQRGEGGVSWEAKAIALQQLFQSWSPMGRNSRSAIVSKLSRSVFLWLYQEILPHFSAGHYGVW